jgi:peptidoglycan biosynthesis protein MviN/MurJ (putative lipid II flippase)
VGGLALATSVSSWFNVLVLGIMLHARIKAIDIMQIIKVFFKTVIASSIMAAASYYTAYRLFSGYILIATASSLVTGVITYFLVSIILKIPESKIIFSLLRRK